MSMNSFGHIFRVTTWGESHGPALGATVDGCPPGVPLEPAMIQVWLDKRRPGQNKNMTQRNEPDQVRILSGVYEGKTTGTPIQLMIENTDQRSKDYGEIEKTFRPGHADITYWQKYGIRDPRGGGRSSARETAARVAAGGIAREALKALLPGLEIKGYMTQMGALHLDREKFDWDAIDKNPFWLPDNTAVQEWEDYLQRLRTKENDSVGAAIEVVVRGAPAGLGAPIYAKLDTDLAAAMMSINAVKCRRDLHRQRRSTRILVKPCRRDSGRDFKRPGHRRPLCGQTHQLDPDAAPVDHQIRRANRGRDQGPSRPLRRHSRRSCGGSYGGLRHSGSRHAAPRPDGRRRAR